VRKLLVLALVVAAAGPAAAWDKAPNAKKRLEILADGAKRADEALLASCFLNPPGQEVLQNLFAETREYDKAVSDVFRAATDKLSQEGVNALGDQHEAVSPLHYLFFTDLKIESVKVDEEKGRATAHCTFADKDEIKGPIDFVVVKAGDDWRIVFDAQRSDQVEWPAGPEALSAVASGIGKATETLTTILSGIREDKFNAENIGEPFGQAKGLMKDLFGKMRKAREEAEAAAKEKAAAAAAEEAKKQAAAEKAAADEAAKKEAAKKEEAKKKELPKRDPPKVEAPPPPPVAAKKPEGEEPKEETKPEPDHTGVYIVFGILAIACLVTVGILISKIREGKRGAGRSSGGGGKKSGRGRASGGRRRRRPGRSSSSGGDDEDEA